MGLRQALSVTIGVLSNGLGARERQLDRIIVSSILNRLGAATACG
jgi:hypothetical protein